MIINGANIPLDGNALSSRADATADKSVREDQKLARSRRAAAASNQIDRSRKQIADTKKEADESLQAQKDKSGWSIFGVKLGLGCILAAIAIVAIFTPAAPLAAIILTAGVTAGGLASKWADNKGNQAAEDNEAKAAEAKQSASSAELMAKMYEKDAQDLQDAIKAADGEAQAIREGARKRRDEQNKISLQS